MKHTISILVKYLSPTNNLGSRIKLTLPRWGNKSITIPFDYDKNGIERMANAFLQNNNIDAESFCDIGQSYSLQVDFSEVKNLLSLFKINA
jgi:hypothetical protein